MRVLSDGPGALVLRNAVEPGIVDAATQAFQAIIAAEAEAGGEASDHFGEPGKNSRIWNALEKLAVTEPEVFCRYYARFVPDA